MKLKHLSALGLGLIAAGAPITSHAKALETKSVSVNRNADMKQPEQITKKRKDSLPDMIGGVQMVNIGGYGIPPHIYGMQHVRKGTHKRTNI